MIKRKFVVITIVVMMLVESALPVVSPRIASANEHGFTRIDGEVRGSSYSLFRPHDWNGDLVLLVHGSIPFIFEFLADDLTSQGFGVAFTTLSQVPGPVEGEALKDVTINTHIVQGLFTANFGKPEHTYLYGFSRAGHNMTNLLETSPAKYDGMLTACAGNGGSQLQWDHFFTARVLFDYYFPGVLPGDPLNMPEISFDSFHTDVLPDIENAILSNPDSAFEMASVEQFNLQYQNFDELVEGIGASLRIHTIGVKSLFRAAKGNPFDNSKTVYTGTSNDTALNTGIARLTADPQARAYLQVWYEPDGSIDGTPVLVLHTSRDPGVPEQLNNDKYEALVKSSGNGDFIVRRVVDRFGHCAFTFGELMANFLDLVNWVETGVRPNP